MPNLDFAFSIPSGAPAQLVGTYIDLTALESAYPTAEAGNLAFVGTTLYYWNPSAEPPAWQVGVDLGGATGSDGQSAYDAWIAYAEAQVPPIDQPTDTIADMFDWLASQAAGDIEITASAEITALPSGSSPTVTVTVS